MQKLAFTSDDEYIIRSFGRELTTVVAALVTFGHMLLFYCFLLLCLGDDKCPRTDVLHTLYKQLNTHLYLR
jgi:hypothetical protein